MVTGCEFCQHPLCWKDDVTYSGSSQPSGNTNNKQLYKNTTIEYSEQLPPYNFLKYNFGNDEYYDHETSQTKVRHGCYKQKYCENHECKSENSHFTAGYFSEPIVVPRNSANSNVPCERYISKLRSRQREVEKLEEEKDLENRLILQNVRLDSRCAYNDNFQRIYTWIPAKKKNSSTGEKYNVKDKKVVAKLIDGDVLPRHLCEKRTTSQSSERSPLKSRRPIASPLSKREELIIENFLESFNSFGVNECSKDKRSGVRMPSALRTTCINIVRQRKSPHKKRTTREVTNKQLSKECAHALTSDHVNNNTDQKSSAYLENHSEDVYRNASTLQNFNDTSEGGEVLAKDGGSNEEELHQKKTGRCRQTQNSLQIRGDRSVSRALVDLTTVSIPKKALRKYPLFDHCRQSIRKNELDEDVYIQPIIGSERSSLLSVVNDTVKIEVDDSSTNNVGNDNKEISRDVFRDTTDDFEESLVTSKPDLAAVRRSKDRSFVHFQLPPRPSSAPTLLLSSVQSGFNEEYHGYSFRSLFPITSVDRVLDSEESCLDKDLIDRTYDKYDSLTPVKTPLQSSRGNRSNRTEALRERLFDVPFLKESLMKKSKLLVLCSHHRSEINRGQQLKTSGSRSSHIGRQKSMQSTTMNPKGMKISRVQLFPAKESHREVKRQRPRSLHVVIDLNKKPFCSQVPPSSPVPSERTKSKHIMTRLTSSEMHVSDRDDNDDLTPESSSTERTPIESNPSNEITDKETEFDLQDTLENPCLTQSSNQESPTNPESPTNLESPKHLENTPSVDELLGSLHMQDGKDDGDMNFETSEILLSGQKVLVADNNDEKPEQYQKLKSTVNTETICPYDTTVYTETPEQYKNDGDDDNNHEDDVDDGDNDSSDANDVSESNVDFSALDPLELENFGDSLSTNFELDEEIARVMENFDDFIRDNNNESESAHQL